MNYYHELAIEETALPKAEFEELCRRKPEARTRFGFLHNVHSPSPEGDEIVQLALGLLKKHGVPRRMHSNPTCYGYCVSRFYEKADIHAAELLLLDYQRKVQKTEGPRRDERGRLIIFAANAKANLKCGSIYMENAIFVSNKVRQVLESGGFVGLRFAETSIKGHSTLASSDPVWELQSAITLPTLANTHQLVHRGLTEAEPFRGDYSREVVFHDAPFVGGEPHYRRTDLASLGPFDIANMFEKYVHSLPPLIISQRFYQHCAKNKIPLNVEPVRIDPD